MVFLQMMAGQMHQIHQNFSLNPLLLSRHKALSIDLFFSLISSEQRWRRILLKINFLNLKLFNNFYRIFLDPSEFLIFHQILDHIWRKKFEQILIFAKHQLRQQRRGKSLRPQARDLICEKFDKKFFLLKVMNIILIRDRIFQRF